MICFFHITGDAFIDFILCAILYFLVLPAIAIWLFLEISDYIRDKIRERQENKRLQAYYDAQQPSAEEIMDELVEDIGGKDGLRKAKEIWVKYKKNPAENFNCLDMIEAPRYRPEKVDYNSGPLGLGGIDINALTEIDTYDHRISIGEPVPPTLVDTFICDISRICNKKSKIQIVDVLQAFEVYITQPFNDIPGYRPRAHSEFIDQLFKSKQLEILANQVVDYIDNYGIRDIN